MERESQETHKREKGEWKQSQVQDNDKVKCALNGSVQSERDKAQPADKVCAAEGNGRSGKALGIDGPSTYTLAHAVTISKFILVSVCWNPSSLATPAGKISTYNRRVTALVTVKFEKKCLHSTEACIISEIRVYN